MAMSDLELDGFEIARFFVFLADQDADLVIGFLRSAGVEPGCTLPETALMKLAVFCRLALWEEDGVTTGANDQLPSAHSVFMDTMDELEGKSPQFDVGALLQRVHMFALHRLTWPQTSGASAFVLDDEAQSTDVLDSMAELLWRYRHLAETGNSPAAAGATSNLEGESAETSEAA